LTGTEDFIGISAILARLRPMGIIDGIGQEGSRVGGIIDQNPCFAGGLELCI